MRKPTLTPKVVRGLEIIAKTLEKEYDINYFAPLMRKSDIGKEILVSEEYALDVGIIWLNALVKWYDESHV